MGIFGHTIGHLGVIFSEESGLHSDFIVLAWSYAAAQATTFYFSGADVHSTSKPHAVTQTYSGTLCISVSCSQMARASEKREGSTSEAGGIQGRGLGKMQKYRWAQGPSPVQYRAFESGILVHEKNRGVLAW